MKKLFILLFSTLSLTIFSQSSVYKPFCNNPSWSSVAGNFGITWYYTYQYQIDTTIGIYTYKKIQNVVSPFDYALFREDVASKKVYQYDITNSLDYLYVDFSLNLGSTFNVTMNGSVISTTVTSKDSILINGCYHNRMWFEINPPPYPTGYRFIEGILSDINPLNPYWWPGDPQVRLVCECHNGQSYYYDNGGFANYQCYFNCSPASQCSQATSLNELTFSEENVAVFPNPSNNLIFIKGEIDLRGKKYVIFDYTSKEVLSNNYNSEKGIDIYSLKSGIYTLSVNNSFMKFIKID